MRQGATEDVEVWVILETGKDFDDYHTKSIFLYYNNGISDKLLAVYRSFLLTTTTAEGPPLGATWDYHSLEVDETVFTDNDVTYNGKLIFTVSKEVSNILQQCKVRKPSVFIEVVLEDIDDSVIKEEYELTDYFDSISAGLI